MKRFYYVALLLCLLFAGNAYAGTATADLYDEVTAGYRYIDINVTGNGSATVVDLSSCTTSRGVTVNLTDRLKGFYIYRIETKPGTSGATPAAYTVSIADLDSFAFITTPARSTTTKEYYPGYAGTGQYETLIGKLIVTVSAAIETGDTTLVRLVLGKWRD